LCFSIEILIEEDFSISRDSCGIENGTATEVAVIWASLFPRFITFCCPSFNLGAAFTHPVTGK